MGSKIKIAIVGTGPGGLAAATELATCDMFDITLFEKGRTYKARTCPVDIGLTCSGCKGRCNVISGFGGCLHFGDATKLSMYPSGRRLKAFLGDQYDSQESCAVDFFGASMSQFSQNQSSHVNDLEIRAYPVAELDEPFVKEFLQTKFDQLNSGCTILTRSRVLEIHKIKDSFLVHYETGGTEYEQTFQVILLATGRSGIGDTRNWLSNLGIQTSGSNVSLGVRFEMPGKFLLPFYEIHRDFKFSKQFDSNKVKSFCFSYHPSVGGRIKYCHYQDQFDSQCIFLDGHSMVACSKPSKVGNFALISQVPLEKDTSPYDWINSSFLPVYERVSNCRPIWQPLSELLSTTNGDAVPSVQDIERGKIDRLIPKGILASILEAFRLLAFESAKTNEAPVEELISSTTVLAPEVEFAWDTVDLDEGFESSVKNCFLIGDCAGIAQGNLQAAISGISAARKVISNHV